MKAYEDILMVYFMPNDIVCLYEKKAISIFYGINWMEEFLKDTTYLLTYDIRNITL